MTSLPSVRRPCDGEFEGILLAEPSTVARPSDAAACAEALKAAAEENRTVLPHGAGRHQRAYGAPSADIVLDLRGLSGIVDHDVGDQTLTAHAGTPLAEVQAAANKHRQWLPLDPTGAMDATLGGIISAGVAGPLRTGFGPARDHLLGTEAAYVDGVVAQSGGRLVKNVTGFDIHRLQHGAHGTLAVLTRVHLRLRPMPVADRTLVARMDTEALDRFHESWRASGTSAAALSVRSDERQGATAGFDLAIRFSGSLRAVEAAMSTARSCLRVALAEEVSTEEIGAKDSAAWWSEWVDGWVPPAGGVTIRAQALPMQGPASRIGELVLVLQRTAAEHGGGSFRGVAVEPMSGTFRVVFEELPMPGLVPALSDSSAFSEVVIEDGPTRYREGVLGELQAPRVQARLKDALDPRRILSPGRFPFPDPVILEST